VSPILVVGRGFIGQAVAAALGPAEARLAGHDEIGRADLLHGVATVLYAGRNPALGTDAWRPEDDPELVLARRAASGHQAFVTLGTRKVYAPSLVALNETDRVGPVERYGQQKLELEHALLAVLGPRLTRLRLANIFGFETSVGRTTFMAAMLAGLARRDEIRFDVSPFVRRDFLPIEFCAPWLAELTRHPPGGVLNVGSGVPLPVGRMALWLIEGHGRGRLVIDRPDERDQFVLDTRSLKGLLGGAACGEDDLRASCLAIGRRLHR
jgi:UDP-glucose 4-epimerase